MAWVVGTTASGAAVASATSAAIDTTGANLLAAMSGDDVSGVNAPTDSKSNTWTNSDLDPGTAGATTGRSDYAKAAVVGTGHTFTVNVAGTDNCCLVVDAFSGRDTVAPLDVHSIRGSQASGNPHTGTAATTTATDDVWGGIIESDATAGNTITANGAWTMQGSVLGAGGRSAGSETQNAVAAGSFTPSFNITNNPTVDQVIALMTFKAGAGVVDQNPIRYGYGPN